MARARVKGAVRWQATAAFARRAHVAIDCTLATRRALARSAVARERVSSVVSRGVDDGAPALGCVEPQMGRASGSGVEVTARGPAVRAAAHATDGRGLTIELTGQHPIAVQNTVGHSRLTGGIALLDAARRLAFEIEGV